MSAFIQSFAGALKSTFSLSLEKTLTEMAQAPQRTRFMQVQRRTRFVLCAMWEREFELKQNDVSVTDQDELQPYIEDELIHLPSEFTDLVHGGKVLASGQERYQAAAAHAAAHIMYSIEPFSRKSLDKLQCAAIAAVEDARVEALAIRQFPGLRRLWTSQHTVTPAQDKTARGYLDRLARALLDEAYQDDDPWIAQGRADFAAADLTDSVQVRALGLQLAQGLRAKRVRMDLKPVSAEVPYRDDNRRLWNQRRNTLEVVNPYRGSRVISRDGKPVDPPKDKDRKDDIRLQDDQAGAATFFYPEWNYRSMSADQNWVTLHEVEPETGKNEMVEQILEQHRPLVARMRKLLRGMRDVAVRRIRRLEEGDELDVNAAVRNMIDMRMGRQPDPRIMMRLARKERDLSVLLLLDQSGSMKDQVPGHEHSAMELTRQIGVLMADAIEAGRDPFAIHGFSSSSRHNVEYFRMKDFDQRYDDTVKARLAGMAPREGTRMGAAIRHATHHMDGEKAGRKLLIMVSDGEPKDADVIDRHYLHLDAKMAVEEAARHGIHTYCISFDPAADQYVARIFGARNFMVVDHVRHLPEKVLLLYAALTR